MKATLKRYLEREHERLDELLSELEERVHDPRDHLAQSTLGQFAIRLDRYIRGEEAILFPVFDQLSEPRATEAMRREHQRLRRLADEMNDALGHADHARCLAALRALRSVLLLHNVKEDGVIYPLVALALGGANQEALIRHMQTA